jgi:hypothetical protein
LKDNLPPRSVPILIKEESGRILAGVVATIYNDNTMLRLDKVSLLEVVGMKRGLEPIYNCKAKSIRYAFIRVDDIVHWEKLPDYLKLQD